MFKFIYEDEGYRNVLELTDECLTHDKVAEYFTNFLRGCGYVFDHMAAYDRLVTPDGEILPDFEEKYQKIMTAAEERYEETGSTFPVI